MSTPYPPPPPPDVPAEPGALRRGATAAVSAMADVPAARNPRTVQTLAVLFIGLATAAAVVGLVWNAVVVGSEASINTLGLIATAGLGLLGGAVGFRAMQSIDERRTP